MDGVLDNHFINSLEQKLKDSTFARVDSNTIDKIIEKDDEAPSKLDDKQKETLKEVIERSINKEKFNVIFENLSETDMPVTITQNEFMRRMKDMEKVGGGGGMMMGMGSLPESFELIVNTNNPLITKVMDEKEADKQDAIVKQLYDLARLAKNLLVGKELNDFVKRNVSEI